MPRLHHHRADENRVELQAEPRTTPPVFPWPATMSKGDGVSPLRWLGRSTALARLTSPNATHPATIARHPAPRCPPVLGYRGKDMSMNKRRNKSRTGPEQVLQPQRTVLPREHPPVPSRPRRECDAGIGQRACSGFAELAGVTHSHGVGIRTPGDYRQTSSAPPPSCARSQGRGQVDEQAMEQVMNTHGSLILNRDVRNRNSSGSRCPRAVPGGRGSAAARHSTR